MLVMLGERRGGGEVIDGVEGVLRAWINVWGNEMGEIRKRRES